MNNLLTPQVIANELLRRFENNLGFAGTVKHEYDDRFANEGGKIGDALNLRVPVKLLAIDGAVMSLQDITENKIPLVIDQQKHTAFQFTSKDLTLTVDQFGKRYLDSASLALANAVDVFLLTKAYQSIPNAVGVPGTIPTALLTYLQAGEALDRNAAPMDSERYVCINPSMQTKIVDALKTLFQSSTEISKQYVKGKMGTAAGFDWLMDQNIRTHNLGGLGGTPLIDGAQTGASILTKNWTNAVGNRLKKGDIFTIGSGATGVYAVNPVSGDALQDLKQFVVTADVASTVGGAATLPIYPSIITSGPYKTCSTAAADGATINVFQDAGPTAGLATPQGLAYHRDFMQWAMVPLEMPRGVHFAARQTNKKTGISIRIVSQYDITNDVFATRCDIMLGAVLTHPEWGCRVAS